jgi:hypothetical protein
MADQLVQSTRSRFIYPRSCRHDRPGVIPERWSTRSTRAHTPALGRQGTRHRKLPGILRRDRPVRAYLVKEDFQQFWQYNSPHWFGMFLDFWCNQTTRSGIEPIAILVILGLVVWGAVWMAQGVFPDNPFKHTVTPGVR